MERGLLIIAKRRSAMAFHTTQERFVPAAEICDVYREGNSVRVDLRGDLKQRDYFQFWTTDAATAGTIVRLLPTTRTIEYEGASAIPVPASKTPLPHRRRSPARSYVLIALTAGFIGIASLITVDRLRQQPPDRGEHTVTVPTTGLAAPTAGSSAPATGLAAPTTGSSATTGLTAPTAGSSAPATGLAAPATGPSMTSAQSTVAQHRATTAEIEVARADLRRFDERIDGLRAQYRMAFAALQSGSLSQDAFIEGLDRWLLPQWRTLYGELGSKTLEDGSLDFLVRRHLMRAVWGWQVAMDDYVRGLTDQDAATVLEAFDRMSAANEAQRRAWTVIEGAER
jgi:hypothetical protein